MLAAPMLELAVIVAAEGAPKPKPVLAVLAAAATGFGFRRDVTVAAGAPKA